MSPRELLIEKIWGRPTLYDIRCIRVLGFPFRSRNLLNCARARPKSAIQKSIFHFRSWSATEAREQNSRTYTRYRISFSESLKLRTLGITCPSQFSEFSVRARNSTRLYGSRTYTLGEFHPLHEK